MCLRLFLFRCSLGIRVVRNVSNFNTNKIVSVSNKCMFRFGCNPTALSPPLSINILQSANFCYKTCSNFNNEISSCSPERDNCPKISHLFCRSYSKKRNASQLDSESSDEEELDDVLDKYDKSSKIVKIHLPSLRVDLVVKSALGLARNKVDTAFYESRIRINGERVLKKSQRLNVGDEVDLIKAVSPVNPDILTVARVEILSAKPDEEEIYVRLRRFKTLQIENYENAPYKVDAKEVKS